MPTVDARRDLERIARASLSAVDPRAIIARTIRLTRGRLRVGTREIDLRRITRILVLGFGKAAGPMAAAVEEALGDRVEAGLVVVKPGHEWPLRKIRQVAGGHPVPDETSARAAVELAALADAADERTFVITLISGGGSSLLAAPIGQGSPVSLEDIRETTRQLLACGAAIEEMNCIRKHLLLLAGGRLARRIHPAASVSLILSDVVGDDLGTIASGPTCPDVTTFGRALSIIRSYGLAPSLPVAVTEYLEAGEAGKAAETPKPGSPEFSNVSNLLVGTNLLALKRAAAESRRLGYRPVILTSHLAGEAREAARVIAALAKDAGSAQGAAGLPACLLLGGETTVTLRGSGTGGRNQEMALAFLREMERDPARLSGTSFLSFSTDGEDGPTDAAGGFASLSLVEAARAAGLHIEQFLQANDSHTLLKEIKGLFSTGPTNTNVCDIQIALVKKAGVHLLSPDLGPAADRERQGGETRSGGPGTGRIRLRFSTMQRGTAFFQAAMVDWDYEGTDQAR